MCLKHFQQPLVLPMYNHPLTPKTAVCFISYASLSCLFTIQGGSYICFKSHKRGSSLCIMTGLDLGSVILEYKLIQKKKKKKQLNIDVLILLRLHYHLSHSLTASSSICFGFLWPPGQDSPSGLINHSHFQFLPL